MNTEDNNNIEAYDDVNAYLASLGTSPTQEQSDDFRSGFVALLGEPNAGKSTLVNKLLDFKIAIVSPKAQTTRDRIFGIYTDKARQAVFIDTPGVMEPQDRLNECLRDSALQALEDADVVIHLFDATRRNPLPEAAAKALAKVRKPVVLAINKCDTSPELTTLAAEADANERWQACKRLFPTIENFDIYEEVFFISAKDGIATDTLLDGITNYLPEGPLLFDPDQPTDRPLRFLASEIVREKVLQNFEEEIPYAVATQTEEFVERENAKHYIRVVIFVEHDSQKAILIGKDGSKLRTVGAQARPEIEAIADHPVYLELWVKVMKNWRKKDHALQEFGYQSRKPKKKNKKRRR